MRLKETFHDDGLKQYIKTIDKHKPLTMEAERQLGKRIKKGDVSAIDTLVNHNLKFVVSTARKYANRGVPLMELVCEGNAGLLKAAQKYDGDRNIKFITYAVWWIKYYISECIERHKINAEYSLEDMETNKAMCAEINNYSIANDEFEENMTMLQSQGAAVEELLKCLHDRELNVIKMFYGLTDGKEMTLEEVGDRMHLTMERVRQIKDSALSKLKCEALSMSRDDFHSFKELV